MQPDDDGDRTRRMPAGLVALAAGGFGIGLTEFVWERASSCSGSP
jgi:predicted MFS family arabinose efflux permease